MDGVSEVSEFSDGQFTNHRSGYVVCAREGPRVLLVESASNGVDYTGGAGPWIKVVSFYLIPPIETSLTVGLMTNC